MSGYAQDHSKSNNAIAAENSGRFPASILAKQLRVKTGAIRALCHPCEWHHTSKFYNSVDYYDLESAHEIITELRAWKAPAKNLEVFEHCSGAYLIWSGSRRHPRATLVTFSGVKATRKGDWFTLELDAVHLRKRKDTTGFVIRDSHGKRLNW